MEGSAHGPVVPDRDPRVEKRGDVTADGPQALTGERVREEERVERAEVERGREEIREQGRAMWEESEPVERLPDRWAAFSIRRAHERRAKQKQTHRRLFHQAYAPSRRPSRRRRS
jgi:hypothetical protein